MEQEQRALTINVQGGEKTMKYSKNLVWGQSSAQQVVDTATANCCCRSPETKSFHCSVWLGEGWAEPCLNVNCN